MKRLALTCAILMASMLCLAQTWKAASYWNKKDGSAAIVMHPVLSKPFDHGKYTLELSPFAGATTRTNAAIGGVALDVTHDLWAGFNLLAGIGYAQEAGQKGRLGAVVGISIKL